MHELVESSNIPEVYNSYAVWILGEGIQHFCTGAHAVKMPVEDVTKPYGLRSFIKTLIPNNEREVIRFEQECSKFLTRHPDKLAEKADIFAAKFPGVIKYRTEHLQKQEQQEQEKTENGLNQLFEQQSLDFPKVTRTVAVNDTVQQIRDLGMSGAKSVKSPDGWEVQF